MDVQLRSRVSVLQCSRSSRYHKTGDADRVICSEWEKCVSLETRRSRCLIAPVLSGETGRPGAPTGFLVHVERSCPSGIVIEGPGKVVWEGGERAWLRTEPWFPPAIMRHPWLQTSQYDAWTICRPEMNWPVAVDWVADQSTVLV